MVIKSYDDMSARYVTAQTKSTTAITTIVINYNFNVSSFTVPGRKCITISRMEKKNKTLSN